MWHLPIRSGLAQLLMRLMEGSWRTPGVDILWHFLFRTV
jgi:hypothetical protein